MSIVQLGQTVRDVITGFEGVAVGRYEYLHGCVRIGVASKQLHDHKPIEEHVIDEQRLTVLDVPNVLDMAPATNRPGGERPAPKRPEPPRY